MALVAIREDIHTKIKEVVAKNNIKYNNVTHLVNLVLSEFVEKELNESVKE